MALKEAWNGWSDTLYISIQNTQGMKEQIQSFLVEQPTRVDAMDALKDYFTLQFDDWLERIGYGLRMSIERQDYTAPDWLSTMVYAALGQVQWNLLVDEYMPQGFAFPPLLEQ